jgi:hypothetical protein
MWVAWRMIRSPGTFCVLNDELHKVLAPPRGYMGVSVRFGGSFG